MESGATSSVPPVDWEDRVWRWEDHGPRPANRADRLFRDYRSAVPARLADVLGRNTATPGNCLFGRWVGVGFDAAALDGAPQLLLRGGQEYGTEVLQCLFNFSAEPLPLPPPATLRHELLLRSEDSRYSVEPPRDQAAVLRPFECVVYGSME